MFIAVQVIDQVMPVILNTNKICSIEYKQEDVISILFDNQVEIELPISDRKEFHSLIRNLAAVNRGELVCD